MISTLYFNPVSSSRKQYHNTPIPSIGKNRFRVYIYWPNKNSSNNIIDHLTYRRCIYLIPSHQGFSIVLGDSHCTLTIDRILYGYNLQV